MIHEKRFLIHGKTFSRAALADVEDNLNSSADANGEVFKENQNLKSEEDENSEENDETFSTPKSPEKRPRWIANSVENVLAKNVLFMIGKRFCLGLRQGLVLLILPLLLVKTFFAGFSKA